TCLAMSLARAMNWSLLADGAVSQRISTIAATFAALSTNTPIRPSAVSLPSRLACILANLLRRISIAFSASPFASTRACLQSPIGRSVRSRSCLTIWGVIGVLMLSPVLVFPVYGLVVGKPRVGVCAFPRVIGHNRNRETGNCLTDRRRRGRVRFDRLGLLTGRLLAGLVYLLLLGWQGSPAFQTRIGQLAQDDLDRADAVVVAGDRQIDRVRVAVGVDQGDGGDAHPLGFLDRDVLPVRADDH